MTRLRSRRAASSPLALGALVGLLSMAPLGTAAAQMDEPAWKTTVTAAGASAWLIRLRSGMLLMGTQKDIRAVDPATGTTVWTRTDLGGLTKAALDQLQPDLAVLNVPTKGAPMLRAIDLRDGKDRWSMSGISLGHWTVPSKQALMVWLWRPSDKMTAKEFGGRMMMVNLADGKVIWEDAAFFAKWAADRDPLSNLWRVQGPLFDTDSTMITFMSVNGIRRVNVNTGKGVWDADLSLLSVTAPYYGYAPLMMDGTKQTVFVPTGLELASVSLADGAVKSRAKLKGIPQQMELVPTGMLIKTGSEVEARPHRAAGKLEGFFVPKANQKPVALEGQSALTLVDPASGEKKWKNEFRLGSRSTNFVVRGDKAYIWSDDRISALTLANGDEQVLAKLPGFREGDAPAQLLQTESGLLLRGETNMMLVDYSGKLVHHTSVKRPKRSMFVRAMSGALKTGSEMVAGNPNDVLGALVNSGAVGIGDPDATRKLSTQTFHEGMRSAMYSTVKRGNREENGFLLFDAMTGKSTGDVITEGLLNSGAFSDKDVHFAFDLVGGWIYYLEVVNYGNGTLAALKLGAK